MLREHLHGRLAFSSVFHHAPFHYPRDIGGKKKSPNNQSTSVATDNTSGGGGGVAARIVSGCTDSDAPVIREVSYGEQAAPIASSAANRAFQ